MYTAQCILYTEHLTVHCLTVHSTQVSSLFCSHCNIPVGGRNNNNTTPGHLSKSDSDRKTESIIWKAQCQHKEDITFKYSFTDHCVNFPDPWYQICYLLFTFESPLSLGLRLHYSALLLCSLTTPAKALATALQNYWHQRDLEAVEFSLHKFTKL